MQIFVKTLTGRKAPFNVEPEQTVCVCVCFFSPFFLPQHGTVSYVASPVQILELKTMLQEKEGIDVKQIRLIHNGRQLADDKSMTACDIQAGTTLHMVCAASKSKKKPRGVFFFTRSISCLCRCWHCEDSNNPGSSDRGLPCLFPCGKFICNPRFCAVVEHAFLDYSRVCP